MSAPRDVEIGRDLAGQLRSMTLPARFSYDPYFILENLPEDNTILITTEAMPSTLLARKTVTYDTTLRMIYIVEQKANLSDESVMDRWLNHFDDLIGKIWKLPVGPKGKTPLEIDTPERFNRAWLQDNSRLVIFSDIRYSLI